MKRCSTSLVIRETYTKTTTRYYFTPTKMAIVKRRALITMTSVGENVENLEHSYSAGGVQNGTDALEKFCSFSNIKQRVTI